MKGLRLYLTPFAPDQSGAVSVLYSLDGMIVILDAGGCTGNVLGFDEPRWQSRKAAVFSAGLRDMDAIMGRDEELTRKAAAAFPGTGCSFIAVVGTPVPSVIGTDYRALGRMLGRRCGCPVITIPTNGMETAEDGLEKTYLALFRQFAGWGSGDGQSAEAASSEEHACTAAASRKKNRTAGVIGCTPLELVDLSDQNMIRQILTEEGYERVVFYGADASREDYEYASANRCNFVLSGSGLSAARYLKETFGTPYTVVYPGIEKYLPAKPFSKTDKVLILHDPVPAAALREALIRRDGLPADQVETASFFAVKNLPEGMLTRRLREESDLLDLLRDGKYTAVIADPVIGRMPLGGAHLVPFPSFAISGKRILT